MNRQMADATKTAAEKYWERACLETECEIIRELDAVRKELREIKHWADMHNPNSKAYKSAAQAEVFNRFIKALSKAI